MADFRFKFSDLFVHVCQFVVLCRFLYFINEILTGLNLTD